MHKETLPLSSFSWEASPYFYLQKKPYQRHILNHHLFHIQVCQSLEHKISRNNEWEIINVSFYLVPKWRAFSTLVCGLARVIFALFSWLCITRFKEGCNCIVELLFVKRFGYIAIHATLETPGLCCLDHISCHGKYGYPHWAALGENANRHPLWSFLLCLPYKMRCFKPADTITRLYTWGGKKETQLRSPHSLGLPMP